MPTADELYAELLGINVEDPDAIYDSLLSEDYGSPEAMGEIPGLGGPPAEPQPAPEFGMGERAIGQGEAALTVATGAAATIPAINDTINEIITSIEQGYIGTDEAKQKLSEAFMGAMQRNTYQPRTEAGQQYARNIGEFGEQLAPLTGLGGELSAIGSMAPAAMTQTSRTMREMPMPTLPRGRGPQDSRSMGAMVSPEAAQRVETARGLPKPFEGETGLTTGQATRAFEDVQFERETAKRGEVGAPIRERYENQTKQMAANFDVMIDEFGPLDLEPRTVGFTVDQALKNRFNVMKKKVDNAYKAARNAGEMEEPISMANVPALLADIDEFSGLSPLPDAIKKQAIRKGIVIEAEDGTLQPGMVTLDEAERFRQFVNKAYNKADKRDIMIRGDAVRAIDADMEGGTGELYKAARKERGRLADEFENVGITKRLMDTKGQTTERQIAFEDVFNKIILDSPVEEINKLRSTLLKGGQEGKDAWMQLKAKTIDHIKSKSFSPSQTDSQGNPIVVPNQMVKVIKTMDEAGKLESLYGKNVAQVFRDLSEVGQVLMTAPPGAVNYSNTASALQVALDSLGTYTLTGFPAPVVTVFKELTQFVKDKKLKAKINEHLKGLED